MIREILNILRIAFRALARNKVRSALTALGMIIGVASVIAMIALSSGARAAIDAQIQSTGTNVVYVSSGSFNRPGGAHGGMGSVQTLTLEDAAAIRDQVPTVARLSPVVRGRAQVVAGNQNWNTSIEGGNEDYLAVRNWPIASGANISTRDVLVADKVCLLGETVAKTLFPGEDPVGQIDPHQEPAVPRHRRARSEGPGAVGPGPGRHHHRALHHPAEEAARHHLHPPGDDLGHAPGRRRADGRAGDAAAAPAPPHPEPGGGRLLGAHRRGDGARRAPSSRRR